MSISRVVYFYRLMQGYNQKGEPIYYDNEELFNHLNSLGSEVVDEREFKIGQMDEDEYKILYLEDGNALTCSVYKNTKKERSLIIGKVRKYDLPDLLKGGAAETLKLEKNEALLEKTHVSFFDNGLIGVEYNSHGPQAELIRHYLKTKLQHMSNHIMLIRVSNSNTVTLLNTLRDISKVSLRLHKSTNLHQLEIDRGLVSAINSMKRIDGSEVFKLEVGVNRKEGKSFLNLREMKKTVKKILSQGEGVKSIYVKGYSSSLGEVIDRNFLNDLFTFRVDVSRQDETSRSVKSSHMFENIEKLYSDNKDELLLSIGIDYE